MLEKNPYMNLEKRAFWRTAIADRSMFSIDELWKPKFKITPESAVSTYGSCFAQHIGKSLRKRGYNWLITENAPQDLSEKSAAELNYGIFSSRTANIYTASLLLQWISWASGEAETPDEIWESEGRFYDPFRPAIENGGFENQEEMVSLRNHTISLFRDSIVKADFFVFTMGLTESWFNKAGYEYPMCPGTAAGSFDPNQHQFLNQDYSFILDKMSTALDAAKCLNPDLRFILTVSPVPLTATNSGNHVLAATMESKSILRAVAGYLARTRTDTDYFPSYEIINGPPFGAIFFEPNKRNVHPSGVEFVMNSFFSAIGAAQKIQKTKLSAELVKPNADLDVGCEEAMLEAYAESSK